MIEEAIIHLIRGRDGDQGNRFYAELISRMRVVIKKGIPSAAVNITDGINLYINPYFWNYLTLARQVEILKHECKHIMHDHIPRFMELLGIEGQAGKIEGKENVQKYSKEAMRLNIAADAAINETLKLDGKFKFFNPDGSCMTFTDKNGKTSDETETCSVAAIEEMLGQTVEHDAVFEYYYNLLKDHEDEQMGEAGTPVDDHGMWGEGDPNSEYVREIVKKVVKDAEEAARQAGSLPGYLEELLNGLYKSKRNWKRDIRTFATRSINILTEPSRKRRNRRYGLMYPGHRKWAKTRIAVVLDTSGSMHLEAIKQCLAEINKLQSDDVDILLMQCDSEIAGIQTINKRITEFNLKGRGGTAFQPALDKAKELGVDGIIYFTDGDCFDTLTEPDFPVLWALMPGCRAPVSWGKTTIIDIEKK